eukprot:TRINITY_DN9091_c0_g1_i1.p1 TRINITY_DN9091_c0_g1~~TRINITY_DN9091_c0_g1_i1.p1  ORF type:complete len:103 (-),score=16.21 TRINITY_DN9091_c0_g1_i1:748-1056(-)
MHVRQYDLDMRDFDMNYMKKNTLKTYLIVFISILYSLVTMQKPQSKKDLYSKTSDQISHRPSFSLGDSSLSSVLFCMLSTLLVESQETMHSYFTLSKSRIVF